MNTANRKPLIAMIALSAALAAPLAFAQDATGSTPPTDAQATTQSQQADVEAAQEAARDAAQEAGESQTESPPTTATQADTATATEAAADASATGAAMQGSQQGTGSAGQQGWEDLDADRDGSISREEAAGNAGLTQIFDNADSDADGVLTVEEYRSFVNKNYEKPQSN